MLCFHCCLSRIESDFWLLLCCFFLHFWGWTWQAGDSTISNTDMNPSLYYQPLKLSIFFTIVHRFLAVIKQDNVEKVATDRQQPATLCDAANLTQAAIVSSVASSAPSPPSIISSLLYSLLPHLSCHSSSSSLPPLSAPSILPVSPLKSVVRLSSGLSQELTSYTGRCLGSFSGCLFLCTLPRL